jgi:hypothetical protein
VLIAVGGERGHSWQMHAIWRKKGSPRTVLSPDRASEK